MTHHVKHPDLRKLVDQRERRGQRGYHEHIRHEDGTEAIRAGNTVHAARPGQRPRTAHKASLRHQSLGDLARTLTVDAAAAGPHAHPVGAKVQVYDVHRGEWEAPTVVTAHVHWPGGPGYYVENRAAWVGEPLVRAPRSRRAAKERHAHPVGAKVQVYDVHRGEWEAPTVVTGHVHWPAGPGYYVASRGAWVGAPLVRPDGSGSDGAVTYTVLDNGKVLARAIDAENVADAMRRAKPNGDATVIDDRDGTMVISGTDGSEATLNAVGDLLDDHERTHVVAPSGRRLVPPARRGPATSAPKGRGKAKAVARKSKTRVVLISCSKTQAKAPRGQKVRADQLYTAGLFRNCLALARTMVASDTQIRILSGRHGLIKLTAKIPGNDLRLHDIGKPKQRAAAQRAWGVRVVEQLRRAFGTARREFVFLAGELYADTITQAPRPLDAGWSFQEPLRDEGIGVRGKHVRTLLLELGSPPRARRRSAHEAVLRSARGRCSRCGGRRRGPQPGGASARDEHEAGETRVQRFRRHAPEVAMSTITKTKHAPTKNVLTVVNTINLDPKSGNHTATATVHRVGHAETGSAGAHGGTERWPRASGPRRSSRQAPPSGKRTSVSRRGRPAPASAGGSSAPYHHELMVLLNGEEFRVYEDGQKAKAVSRNGQGDVVWTGRVSGPYEYATLTSPGLSDEECAELLRGINACHIADQMPAGGGTAAEPDAPASKGTRGTAARSDSSGTARAAKGATAAKRTAARKANRGAKTSKASKARGFVKVMKDGREVNVYGPYSKAEAAKVGNEIAKPGVMSVEVVTVTGAERDRLMKLARGAKTAGKTAANPAAKKTAKKKTAAKKGTKKTAAKKGPPSAKKTAAKKGPPSAKKTAAKKTAAKKGPPSAKKTAAKKTAAKKGPPSAKAVETKGRAATPGEELPPPTRRAPGSVGASDAVVIAQLRAALAAEAPAATPEEIDAMLAPYAASWRSGAREYVYAYMAKHGITDVVEGFEKWSAAMSDELAVVNARVAAAPQAA